MSIITLPIAELKPALVGLGKIICKNPSLPVLGMMKVERTKDGWTLITGTDLDAFVTARLEEPTDDEPTSLLVPFADLQRIVKACDAKQVVTVEAVNDNKTLIRYPIGQQTGEEHLDSLPVDEYPETPTVKTEPVSLDANVRNSLMQAFECASDDQTRYILRGAFIDVSDKKCHSIIGTDGKHLYSSNSFSLALNDSLIIPTNKFLGWKEFNNDGEWQLRVAPGKKDSPGNIQISSRRYRFITKQVEGNYPNWRQVVPKEFKTTVEFTDDSVLDIIPRLPVNQKDTSNTIGLKIEKTKLVMSARSGADDKPTEVEITGVKITGAPVTIHLNRDFMLKALKYGFKKLEITDEMSAMRFSNEGKQLIVMPVKASCDQAPAPPTIPPEAANQPVVSDPVTIKTERSITMPKEPTNGHQAAEPQTTPALESAIAQVETVKDTFRTTLAGLNELTALLKQANREQKVNDREMNSVRQTLRSLQSVRI